MSIKYHFYADTKIPVPVLESMGYADDIEATHFGPSKRNVYLIHYVLSGKGYFNGNTVGQGQGFLISPGQAEHYYADKQQPWAYLWVISADPGMQAFFDFHNADPKTGIFEFHNMRALESVAKILTSVPAGIYFGKHFSAFQMTEYFLSIYNNCVYINKSRGVSSTKQYFDYATSYINSFLHQSITVGSLCDKLGISQPHLYTIFKRESGMSPKEYISRQKLIVAKKLLAETDYFIFEISASVGFSDALAFSKFFSAAEGVSPTEYRRLTRGQ